MATILLPCCDLKNHSNWVQTGRAHTLFRQAIAYLRSDPERESPYYFEPLIEYLKLHNVDQQILSDVNHLDADIQAQEEFDGYIAAEDIEKFTIDRYRNSFLSVDQLLSYMKVGIVGPFSFFKENPDPLKEMIAIWTYGGYDINELIAGLIIDIRTRVPTLSQSIQTIMENADPYLLSGLLTAEMESPDIERRRLTNDSFLGYNLIRIPQYAKFLKWLGYKSRNIIDIAYSRPFLLNEGILQNSISRGISFGRNPI